MAKEMENGMEAGNSGVLALVRAEIIQPGFRVQFILRLNRALGGIPAILASTLRYSTLQQ